MHHSDFPDVIEVLLKLFADNAKVYNIISNLNGVQRSVNNAGTWSIDWIIYFNIKICHDLHVGHHNIVYIYNAGPKAVVLLWFYFSLFLVSEFR